MRLLVADDNPCRDGLARPHRGRRVDRLLRIKVELGLCVFDVGDGETGAGAVEERELQAVGHVSAHERDGLLGDRREGLVNARARRECDGNHAFTSSRMSEPVAMARWMVKAAAAPS